MLGRVSGTSREEDVSPRDSKVAMTEGDDLVRFFMIFSVFFEKKAKNSAKK